MIVVSDTTPLISLIKIGHLDLLQRYFESVLIPDAVFQELVSNTKFQNEAALIKHCPFIRVTTVDDTKTVSLMQKITGLDLGESEAITLSDNINADLLLMDEIKGRQVAEQMGLKIMGTIGLLLAAYEEKHLSSDEIKESISLLRASGRHIGEYYYNLLLERIAK